MGESVSTGECLESASSPEGKGASRLATELEIRESIAAVRAALDKSVPHQPNIWVFFSNKNEALLTIHGDLAFIQCVLLEGDCEVVAYEPIRPTDNGGEGTSLIEIHYLDGASRRIKLAYRTDSSSGNNENIAPDKEEVSQKSSEGVLHISDRDLAHRMVEFSNWLLLCGAMTRARNFSLAHEASSLSSCLTQSSEMTFGNAMSIEGTDPALMLAAIAKALSSGVLTAGVAQNMLSLDMVLRRANSSAAHSERLVPRDSFTDKSGRRAMPMPSNRRTRSHPELFTYPERWTLPGRLDYSTDDALRKRAQAVIFYLHGRSYEAIYRETGINCSWVRKLFKRTLLSRSDGIPLGLEALGRYRHLAPYTRRAPIPVGGMAYGNQGGYAGALTKLLSLFPDALLDMIEKNVLTKRRQLSGRERNIPVTRVSWVELHSCVKEFLRSKGLRDEDYPFNTRNCGYRSLVKFCNDLLFGDPARWIENRGGIEALRLSKIGRGGQSLITPQWINQIVELDYHKVDSATVVDIATPKGGYVSVPLPRWWAGGVVDAYSHLLLATSDDITAQPDEDTFLDLVDIAAFPPGPSEKLRYLANCEDGLCMPGQLLPEYGRQSWDILKLDRAWAHKSTNALSAVIATLGCAVCFGKPRAWYLRNLIERQFGKVTKAGPQMLPTTYGSRPGDSICDHPEENAAALHICQDDVCDLIKATARWINETRDEGQFFVPPIDTLKLSLAGNGKFFPRPFPKARESDRPLMWRTIPTKIEGDAKNGRVPCVRIGRTRFRGNKLAASWHLIGREAMLQVFRRDFRKGRVLLPNGELIDLVFPESKWMSCAMSWHNHVVIQNFGRIQRLHDRSRTPAHDFLQRKQAEIAKSSQKNSRPTKKRDAAICADIMNEMNSPDLVGLLPLQQKPTDSDLTSDSCDALNALGKAPVLKGLVRGGNHG